MARPAYGSRPTCESCPAIDVRLWHRTDHLEPGRDFLWSWRTDEQTSSGIVAVRVQVDAVTLFYTVRTRSEGSEQVAQRVSITWSRLHFGGRRPWFVCGGMDGGHCGRRVAVMYGSGRFACRTCADLAYESQNEAPMFRAARRAQKIREKLGGNGLLGEPFPERPKGMHHTTFSRLRSRAEMSEETAYFLARSRRVRGTGD